MQIDPTISVFSSGNAASPAMTRNAGSQTAPAGSHTPEVQQASRNNVDSGGVLADLPAQPAVSALASGGGLETAVLRESTGSGGVPVKIAAAIYALNASFDIQAQALDLLA